MATVIARPLRWQVYLESNRVSQADKEAACDDFLSWFHTNSNWTEEDVEILSLIETFLNTTEPPGIDWKHYGF